MQLEFPLYDKVPITNVASEHLQSELTVALSSQVATLLHLKYYILTKLPKITHFTKFLYLMNDCPTEGCEFKTTGETS